MGRQAKLQSLRMPSSSILKKRGLFSWKTRRIRLKARTALALTLILRVPNHTYL
jgi:hypothetical protein